MVLSCGSRSHSANLRVWRGWVPQRSTILSSSGARASSSLGAGGAGVCGWGRGGATGGAGGSVGGCGGGGITTGADGGANG